jgi:hypothetical protein
MDIWTCGWRTAGGELAEIDARYVVKLLLLLLWPFAGCYLTFSLLQNSVRKGEFWLRGRLYRRVEDGGSFWVALGLVAIHIFMLVGVLPLVFLLLA